MKYLREWPGGAKIFKRRMATEEKSWNRTPKCQQEFKSSWILEIDEDHDIGMMTMAMMMQMTMTMTMTMQRTMMKVMARKACPTQCHTGCWTRCPMSTFFLHSTSRLGQLTGQGTRTVSNVQLGTLSNRTTAQLHNFDTLRWLLICLWPTIWTAALTSWLVCPPFPVDHQCTFNRFRENNLRKHKSYK